MGTRLQTNHESQPPSSKQRRPRRSSRGISLLEPTVWLICAVFGAIVCYQLAERIGESSLSTSFNQLGRVFPLVSFSMFGFAEGFALGVYLASKLRKGLDYVDELLARISGLEVVAGIIGALLGLVIAALAGIAMIRIPIAGPYLIVPLYFLSSYFTAHLMMKKHLEVLRLFGIRGKTDPMEIFIQPKVLDSSALIDGRVLDVHATGFIEGDLIVPHFVLEELQHLADSSDAEKRVRGRRGLDFVQKLQISEAVVRIDETDYKEIGEVDDKLVRLALELNAVLITTDAPLLKIAEIQGLRCSISTTSPTRSSRPCCRARSSRSRSCARGVSKTKAWGTSTTAR